MDATTPSGAGTPRGAHALALVLAIIAVVAPVTSFAFFPFMALAALGAIVAIVLSIRALARGDRRPIVGWTVALAAVGAVVDIVLVLVFSLALWGPGPDRVELRATGTEFTVEFEDDTQSYTQEWEGDDWAMRYATERSWAEVTVTRADGAGGSVSCTILWNEVVVVKESAGDGRVTCRYDR